MRTVLTAITFLLLTAAGASAANEPLVLGLGVHPQNANVMLSKLTVESLTRDPLGNSPLEPESCKKLGACATPRIYCDEFRRRHKGTGLPSNDAACLAQLSRYIGGLVCRPVSGPAELDRLTSNGIVAPTGHVRKPRKGEYACQDTATGEDMFWTDCGNVPVPALERGCAMLSFNAPVGAYVTWNIGSADGHLPPSECDAQQQGNGPWSAWYGTCGWCTIAIENIEAILHRTAEFIQPWFLYSAAEERQTFRFSTAIETKVVYVCIEMPDGTQVRAFYVRPEDWKGKHHVDVADNLSQ